MQKEPDGMIGVGENEMDLMGGEDISIKYINSLPEIETHHPYVNQSLTCGNPDYRMACTMMSSYVGLLAINGGDENEEEKRAILNEGISRGYQIGKGRWTFQGVKSAIKARNKRHSKKMMYVRCKIGDDTYKTLLKKGYPLITSRMNSAAYNNDKKDNCFIDGENHSQGRRGHAICFMKGIRGSGDHCNTYPKNTCNVFGVKDIEALVNTGFYSKRCYAIIPEKDNTVEEAVKRKLVKTIILLNSKLWKLSGTETQKRLNDMNNYFRDNGF